MFTKHAVLAVAAAGYAAAQAGICTTTATVNSPAEATSLGSDCRSVKGSVVIGSGANGLIDLGGLESISGDLSAEDNGAIIGISGSSLSRVDGEFKLQNVTLLSTLAFAKLQSVGTITWKSLPALSQLTFTSGVSKVSKVEVSDTHLNSLDGLNVETIATMYINNNNRLTQFNSKLVNLSDELRIDANNKNLSVSFPNLKWIANMTIQNVQSFEAPSLAIVNGSAKFDSNYFSSFVAPNLTATKAGDIAFVANEGLSNISFPVLTSIGGGLLIANNTDLKELDGFPKLKTVGGAIKLRGSFTSFAFPTLTDTNADPKPDVKGAFDASSTEEMGDSCNAIKSLGEGKGKIIQGKFTCTSKNATANNDTSSTTGGGGSSSSGTNNTAAGVQISGTLLGLALVGGGFAQLW